MVFINVDNHCGRVELTCFNVLSDGWNIAKNSQNRLRSKNLNDKRLDEQHINVPFVKPFSLANYLAGQLKMS
jgi:hypothetical protein